MTYAWKADVATPMLAMLSIHPSRNKDLADPAPDHHRRRTVPIYDYVDSFGNICTRVTIPPGGLSLSLRLHH